MLPNFSNRPGGYSGFADSGAAHGLHLSGISMAPEPYAAMQAAASGGVDIKVPDPDFTTGSLSDHLKPATQGRVSLRPPALLYKT